VEEQEDSLARLSVEPKTPVADFAGPCPLTGKHFVYVELTPRGPAPFVARRGRVLARVNDTWLLEFVGLGYRFSQLFALPELQKFTFASSLEDLDGYMAGLSRQLGRS
jgi:hypothetical protein